VVYTESGGKDGDTGCEHGDFCEGGHGGLHGGVWCVSKCVDTVYVEMRDRSCAFFFSGGSKCADYGYGEESADD
jgi:hypothetical protein